MRFYISFSPLSIVVAKNICFEILTLSWLKLHLKLRLAEEWLKVEIWEGEYLVLWDTSKCSTKKYSTLSAMDF